MDQTDTLKENNRNDALGPGLIVLSRIINGLIGILLIVILTRLLDKTTFGIFFVVYTFYGTISSIGVLGIPASLLYFLPQTPNEKLRSQGFGSGLALFLIAAIFAGILMFCSVGISSLLKEPSIKNLLYFLALFILLDFPSQIMPNYLLGKRSYNKSILVSLAYSTSLFILIIVPVILGFPLERIFIFFVIGGLIRFIHFLFFFLVIEKEGSLFPDYRAILKQIKYAIPLFFNEMTIRLNKFLDKYFVMVMFTTEMFAIYSVSSRELPFVGMFPYALTTAFIPQLSLLFRKGDRVSFINVWHTAIKKISLIIYPIFFYFFIEAENFLRVLFTEEYISGKVVFQTYLLLLPLRLCAYGGIIQALGKPKYIFFAMLTSLFVNLTLNFPFLKLFGITGPAIAFIVSQVVGILLMLRIIKRFLKISWKSLFPYADLGKVFLVSLLSSVPLMFFPLIFELSPHYRLMVTLTFFFAVYLSVGMVFKVITRSDFTYLRDLVLIGEKR